jgi:methionyl-tRNA formyltransferase
MRIAFIGAERVGLATLRRLLASGRDVATVITATDELAPKIADYVPFDETVREAGVPLVKVRTSKSPEAIAAVRAAAPDLVAVVSWSFIVPPEILAAPALGTVGIHYSLLPARRGGAPLNWAIIDGLGETGISLYYMDESVDTGDVIAQAAFPIASDATAADLLDDVVQLAPELLDSHLDAISAGTAPRVPQDESVATYTPRRKPEDSEIDWGQEPEKLHAFIRALSSPFPNAYMTIGERRLVVPRSRMEGDRLWIEAYVE